MDCCEYSIKAPDDGQQSLPGTCRVLYQIKLRNSVSR